jgi:hypothetical protein
MTIEEVVALVYQTHFSLDRTYVCLCSCMRSHLAVYKLKKKTINKQTDFKSLRTIHVWAIWNGRESRDLVPLMVSFWMFIQFVSSDKMYIDKILFSLDHQIWIWIKKISLIYRIWICIRGFHYSLSVE